MKNDKAVQIAEQIVKLLKDNGFIIRPYEGEVSCCVIETRPNACDGASILCAWRHGAMTVEKD